MPEGAIRPMLSGKLVRLRAREPEDEPRFYEWINNEEVTRYLLARYAFSHAQEREWISATHAPGYHNATFAVEALADGQLIGSVALRRTSAENRSAELALMIGDTAHWHRGHGADTVQVICRFGFEMMNLHRIWLEVFAEHERAIRLYERLGFVHEGRQRDAVFKVGRYHDLLTMSLLEGELRDGE